MIATTHVGSLPRGAALVPLLLARDKGEPYDAAAAQVQVRTHTWIVAPEGELERVRVDRDARSVGARFGDRLGAKQRSHLWVRRVHRGHETPSLFVDARTGIPAGSVTRNRAPM